MAGKIPREFIEELLSRTDIVDLVDLRVPLKKAGRDFTACCPFHSEKTPSFTVSPTKQFYHCFGCGAHGNAISFLMEYERLDFLDAVRELAEHAGLDLPQSAEPSSKGPSLNELFDLMDAAARYYRRQLKEHEEAARAVDYLRSRGLDGKTAKEFGIGFAPPGWHNLTHALAQHPANKRLAEAGLTSGDGGRQYDRFRDRIIFPIKDAKGRVIAFGGRVLKSEDTPKYLNSPETPIFHKGSELYGLYEARQASRALSRILVVEGYMDVVGLAQHDIRYAVATLGTAVNREHMDKVFRVTDEVIFCFDGDRAGREAAWRGLEAALPVMHEGRQLRFMFLPEGEDPDTYVQKIGKEEFERQAASALPLSRFLFDQLVQQVDLSSIDGRARLVELARPLLMQIPQGLFRQMMVDHLSERAKVERSHLSAIAPVASIAATPMANKAPRRSGNSSPSLIRHAIGLLLHEHSLALDAGDPQRFRILRMPGSRLLADLVELLQVRPHLTTGTLLEHWRGTDEARHLVALSSRPPLLPPESDLKTEFLDALVRLDRMIEVQRREELQAKPFKELTEAEKIELQQLLKKEARGSGG